jgi:hypothetical protein
LFILHSQRRSAATDQATCGGYGHLLRIEPAPHEPENIGFIAVKCAEYLSNYLAFLQMKARVRIEIDVVDNNGFVGVDLEALLTPPLTGKI